MASRDQALTLLAAANNHGDLAVKLSSLKQVKDILFSVDPSIASELFPYLAELQSSPQSLVRKSLVEMVEGIGVKVMEHSTVLIPALLALLRDADPVVVTQAIVSGTKLFSRVLEEMAMQIHLHGKVERWLEDIWKWMVKFKDVMFTIALEKIPARLRLLALKFLETYVLLFSSDNDDSERPVTEAVAVAETKRIIGTLFDLLQAAPSLPGCVTITIVNWKAPVDYSWSLM